MTLGGTFSLVCTCAFWAKKCHPAKLNHYHLLIKSPDVPLDKIMARINRRYSDYYSKKYLHVGRIYEKRYYSKEADGPFAVLAVSSYIHRNPIDTRKPMVEHLIDYPYSSFPMYGSEDLAPKSWIDLDLLLVLNHRGIIIVCTVSFIVKLLKKTRNLISC